MPTDNKILNGSGLTTLVSLIKKDIDTVASSIPVNVSDLTNDVGYITAAEVTGQVQSDWAQATTTAVDFIKNKPVLPEYNILEYIGKTASPVEGDYSYYLQATDIVDGATHVYRVPAYTTTPELRYQVTTKEYVDTQIDAVTTTIPSITVTQGLTTGVTIGSIALNGTTTTLYAPEGSDIKVQQDPVTTTSIFPLALANGGLFATNSITDTMYYTNKVYASGSTNTNGSLFIWNANNTRSSSFGYDTISLGNTGSTYHGIIQTESLTSEQRYTLPNASGTLALQSYVDNAITTAIGGITGVEFNTSYTTYSSLPTTGAPGTIYLIPNNGTTPNIYDEYIYASNTYEKIGTTEVDLTNYVTATDMTTALTPYAQSTALTPYVIEYNGTVNAEEAYAAYEAGRSIVLRDHGYEVSEGDLALTAIQKIGSSNYYFTFEKSGTSQQQYYSYDTSSGWRKDIVYFVRSTQVTPTSGVTGTAIATIAGKTIYAPVSEEGITTETDPVYSASPAAGITTGDITRWNNSAPTTVATTTTNGLMSSSDKTKLNGIADGAEVNVQSDWAVTTTTNDAFIKNKPTITYDSTNTSLVFSGF